VMAVVAREDQERVAFVARQIRRQPLVDEFLELRRMSAAGQVKAPPGERDRFGIENRPARSWIGSHLQLFVGFGAPRHNRRAFFTVL